MFFMYRFSRLFFLLSMMCVLAGVIVSPALQAKGSSSRCCGGCRGSTTSTRSASSGGYMPHYFFGHRAANTSHAPLPESFWRVVGGAAIVFVMHHARRFQKKMWLRGSCSCSIWCCQSLQFIDCAMLMSACVIGYCFWSFFGLLGVAIGMFLLWFYCYLRRYPTGA